MRRNTEIIIILIVLSAIGVFIYKSPDEAYRLKENPQDAIETGRAYSYYLLNNNKEMLLIMSANPAKAKIENLNVQSRVMYSQLEEKHIHIDIIAPLFAEQKDEDMELITLENLQSFIVMTFAYKNGDKIVEIPGKGKMLFSVAVRYYKSIDDRLVPKLVRKIANLPLLHNFTGRIGTTGRWVVFDYNYKYNLNDYFDWVLKEGENYSQKQLKESEEFLEQLSSKEFDESVDRGLDFLYEWGSMAVEKQIKRIERVYKVQQEVEKNGKLEAE